MRYPKFREFQEAKEKGLATEPAGTPNKYPDGGKGPNVGKGFADISGNTPNKEKDGGKGPNVGDGLGNEKAHLTKDQWIPKVGKRHDLIKLEKSLTGNGDYKGFLATNNYYDDFQATKMGEENKETLPYEKIKDFYGVYVTADPNDPISGFAFDATPGLTPVCSGGEKPDFKYTKVNIAKLTSEQFIEQTGEMTPEEFIKFYEHDTGDQPLPTVSDLYGNQFTPDPNQVIEYIVALAVKNPRLMTRLVREVKRHEGGFGSLFNESKDHPEFFDGLVESMGAPEGEGRNFCHKISRNMNDNYMGALDKFVMEHRMIEEVQPKDDLNAEDGGPIGASPEIPSGSAPPKMTPQAQGGAFGGGAPGGGGPEMGPPQGGAFGGGSPEAGQETGPTSPVPGMGMGGGPPMPPGGGGVGGAGFDPGTGQPAGQPPAPQKKFLGETAHGNMIEEMGGFPHMHAHMSDFCINGNCKKK